MPCNKGHGIGPAISLAGATVNPPQSGRIDSIRETLATHEQREQLRRDNDIRYRQTREDSDRRAHKQSLTAWWAVAVSLIGVAAALAQLVNQ